MSGDINLIAHRSLREHAAPIVQRANAFALDDDGATMVEYGLMVALIALAAFASVVVFGISLQTLFQNILDDIVAAIQ